MTSKVNPVVPIELSGKLRHLKFDMNAMVAFEEATGKSILRGADLSGGGAKELRALIWACLTHEDENLTLQEVGSWIDTQNMAEISEAFAEAFKAAMPEKEEDEKDASPLPPNP